jgi:RNA polymerase sigma-70 factor (ECF subfamily)
MKNGPGDIRERMASAGTSGAGGDVAAPGPPGRLSRAQFAECFEAARGTLWYIAAAVLGDRSEAEDAVQEAAMTALTKLNEFDASTHFAAWMGQIVRNVSRNHLHKRQRRRTTPTDTRELDLPRPLGERECDPVLNARGDLAQGQEAFDDRLSSALRGLDETARVCLLLRTLAERTYREISNIVGIPEGTAMSHVHRSRAALRKALENGGVA